MSILKRREFLSRMWGVGGALVAMAGAWTSWDLLRPGEARGFGGNIRTVDPRAVPDTGVLEVPAARSYLVNIDGEIRAISRKCPHLGCGVAYCESSGQFECACHGSEFNRAGEHRSGPSPRGMDRHPIEIGVDGLIYIDTGTLGNGPPPGSESIDEPVLGPSCAEEAH